MQINIVCGQPNNAVLDVVVLRFDLDVCFVRHDLSCAKFTRAWFAAWQTWDKFVYKAAPEG